MSLSLQLANLAAADLVQPSGSGLETSWQFRHELVLDFVYQSVLRRDRRLAHRAVAQTLETLSDAGVGRGELAAMLAQHYREAEEFATATHYFLAAGERALAVFANLEAEKHYRAALALLLSSKSPAESQRAAGQVGLGQALMRQSRYAEATDAWRKAIEIYKHLGDFPSVARLYARLARAVSYGGNTPGSWQICQEGLAAVVGQPPSADLAALLHEAVRAAHFNGLPEEVARFYPLALRMAENAGDLEVLAETLASYSFLPNQPPALVISMLERATVVAEQSGALFAAARAWNNYGSVLSAHGRLAEARASVARAAELCRLRGAASEELFCLSQVMESSLELGDFAQAEALRPRLEELRRQARVLTAGGYVYRLTEARVLRYRGELALARAQFQAYRLEMRTRGDWQQIGSVSLYLGELLLELAEWVEAAQVLEEAVEAAQRQVGVSLVSALSLQARAWAGQGQVNKATTVLAELRAQDSIGPVDHFYLTQAEGAVAAQQAHWPEALVAYAAAAEAVAALGMRWYHAQLLVEWAAVLLRRHALGDLAQARVLLHGALALFNQLGITHYVRLTEQHLVAMPEL